MQLVFFTQEDPFYVKKFFDEYLRLYGAGGIRAIVIANPMGKRSLRALIRQMFGFYGPWGFCVMGARFVVTRLLGRLHARPASASRTPRTFTIRQLAESWRIPVLERNDLNSREFVAAIAELSADLLVSVACPIVFKAALIGVPRWGCVNIHNAPLPKYRGMMPNFWQLYFGEKTVGITVHRIDAGIDTGEIVLQRTLPVEKGETLEQLMVRTKKEGARMIHEVVERYERGELQSVAPQGEGSYFSFPTAADVREFKRRGNRIM